jgi:hypothetical protein
MVMKTPQVGTSLIRRPSKLKVDIPAFREFWMVSSCKPERQGGGHGKRSGEETNTGLGTVVLVITFTAVYKWCLLNKCAYV